MRVPQPDIIEHFGDADAVPQLPERCLSRKAGIVRCCPGSIWNQKTPDISISQLHPNKKAAASNLPAAAYLII